MKKTLTVLVTVFLAVCLLVSCDNEDPFFHTVRFDSNGGSSVAEQIVADGEKAERPDNPTYGNYAFMEWQLDGEAYNFDTPVTSDITLKAVWTKYVVSFDSDGGSAVDYEYVLEDGKVRKPSDPTKSGYTFIGWYNGGAAFDFNTVITSDICLLAVWQENTAPVYHTVTFDSDGGNTTYESQSVLEKEIAYNPGTPSREGYTFLGWYNGDVEYDFRRKVTGDITLKAKWGYTVTFKADATETINNQYVVVAPNGTVSADEVTTPKKQNFTFTGWFIDDATEFELGKTKVTENYTLTAKWEESQHTCVVNYNSSKYRNVAYGLKGDELSLADWEITTELIEKAGDSFLGWYYGDTQYLRTGENWNTTKIDVSNKKDFSVTAIWDTSDSYKTITFKNGENTVLTMAVKYEGEINLPIDYTLTNDKGEIATWYEEGKTSSPFDFETIITANTTLTTTTTWSTAYTVKFMVDGKTYLEEKVGDKAKANFDFDVPDREGYTWGGWYEDGVESSFNQSTQITKNYTLNAKFNEVTYIVIFNVEDGSPDGYATTVFWNNTAKKYGDTIAASEVETPVPKDGWTFDGWYYAGIGTDSKDGEITPQKFEFGKTVITENTIVMGKWTYQVTFDATGAVEGTAVASQWVVDGDTVQKPADPTSSFTGDYLIKTFDYWSKDNPADVENPTEFDFKNTKIDEPITLYAVWRDLKVGDRGPSGGYIFYDRGERPYGEWRYYEAAPVNLISRYTSAENLSGVPSTSVEVGQGFMNTYNLLTTTLSTEYPAAIACINYTVTNNGKPCAGWLLPSMKELMLMCSELAAKNLGSWPLDGQYLSSTAIPGSSRMVYGVNFTYRSTATLLCYCNYYVRPMKEYPNSLDYELEELLKLKNNQ